MRRAILGILLLGACSFEPGNPGEAPGGPGSPDAGAQAADGSTVARACHVSDSALRLCLDFEDSPSPVVRDSSGQSHDASATAVQSMPRAGQLAALLTTSSALAIPESTGLDITPALTIEMWVQPGNLGSTSWPLANQGQYALGIDEGAVLCTIGGLAVRGAKLASGQWSHVACSYDGFVIRAYVNGAVTGCGLAVTSIPTGSNQGTQIGAAYVGGLDDVHVYARALADATVCSLAGGASCPTACPLPGGD